MRTFIREKEVKQMFGNPQGEVIRCKCGRWFDIWRKTGAFCACGEFVMSKEFSFTHMEKKLLEVKTK